MKKILLVLSLLFFLAAIPATSHAQKRGSSRSHRVKTVHVRAYTRKNGARVRSYYRSRPFRRHSFIYRVIRPGEFAFKEDIKDKHEQIA